MKILRHLPNFITCLNLMSGCVGIALVSIERVDIASMMIFLAAGFDVLDGLTARLLKAQSSIGKDLDSLADLVSFGVLPSYILFYYLGYLDLINLLNENHWILHRIRGYDILNFGIFIMAVFSALRLAKFNNDVTQKEEFRGLPTPANALFWASIILHTYNNPCAGDSNHDTSNCTMLAAILTNKYMVFLFALAISALLLIPVRLISFKFKSIGAKKDIFKYIFIVSAIVLVVVFGFGSAPFVLFIYFLMSFFHFSLNLRKVI